MRSAATVYRAAHALLAGFATGAQTVGDGGTKTLAPCRNAVNAGVHRGPAQSFQRRHPISGSNRRSRRNPKATLTAADLNGRPRVRIAGNRQQPDERWKAVRPGPITRTGRRPIKIHASAGVLERELDRATNPQMTMERESRRSSRGATTMGPYGSPRMRHGAEGDPPRRSSPGG